MKNAMQLKAIIKNLAKEKTKLQYLNIEPNALREALNATTEKRGSKAVIKDYHRIMDTVRNSDVMQKQWVNYQKDFEYAADIAFSDACDTVGQLMDESFKKQLDI